MLYLSGPKFVEKSTFWLKPGPVDKFWQKLWVNDHFLAQNPKNQGSILYHHRNQGSILYHHRNQGSILYHHRNQGSILYHHRNQGSILYHFGLKKRGSIRESLPIQLYYGSTPPGLDGMGENGMEKLASPPAVILFFPDPALPYYILYQMVLD